MEYQSREMVNSASDALTSGIIPQSTYYCLLSRGPCLLSGFYNCIQRERLVKCVPSLSPRTRIATVMEDVQ